MAVRGRAFLSEHADDNRFRYDKDGLSLAKPIIRRRRPMMGFASLNPSYALFRDQLFIVFVAAVAITTLMAGIAIRAEKRIGVWIEHRIGVWIKHWIGVCIKHWIGV